MKSFAYRHSTYEAGRETTTIRVLGVPIFKRVIIDTEDRPRRACGFTVYASDAPVDNGEDDTADGDDDDEQFIILPYGKEKQ